MVGGLTKRVLETALEDALDEHLGYDTAPMKPRRVCAKCARTNAPVLTRGGL
jgi:hypothetical protein